jgi:hypothetical protein
MYRIQVYFKLEETMKLIFKLLLREMHYPYCGNCPFMDMYTDSDNYVTFKCLILKKDIIWFDGPIASCHGNEIFTRKL